MITIIIAVWLGFLWVLVSMGILNKWHTWMKISPLFIWLVFQAIVFLPMMWSAPSGPVTVMSRSVQIAPNVSGMVTEVNVSGGVPLKRGDVLFKIDPTPYQAVVDEITAKLELAKTQLDQKTRLLDASAGNKTDVQEAQSNVNQLTAQLKAATWNLEHTDVRAPTDGFVSNVVLQPGTRVNTGAAVMPFIDNSEEIIGVQIAQSHLRNIKVGQPAEVIFNLYPGETFPAKVKFILRANPEGQITPTGLALASRPASSQPFWLGLQLDQPEMNIPMGANGNAAIFTEEMPITHIIRRLSLRMQTWTNYLTGK